MTDTAELTIERFIAAPPAAVWDAWSDPAKLEKWWIPAPIECRVARLDLRPGGGPFLPRVGEGHLDGRRRIGEPQGVVDQGPDHPTEAPWIDRRDAGRVREAPRDRPLGVAALEVATDGFADAPGITTPVATETGGVGFEPVTTLKGVEQLDRLDDQRAIVLARAEGVLSLQAVALP